MENYLKKRRRFMVLLGIIGVTTLMTICVFQVVNAAHAQSDKKPAVNSTENANVEKSNETAAAKEENNENSEAPAPVDSPYTKASKYLAAALVMGLSVIGASIAVSNVGSAAMGAVAERPEIMGKSIIFVGIAEGLGIYGLIVALLILFSK